MVIRDNELVFFFYITKSDISYLKKKIQVKCQIDFIDYYAKFGRNYRYGIRF